LGGVNSVAHQLAQKDLVIGVEKLFDDGKNVLGVNGDCTFFLHSSGRFSAMDDFQISFHLINVTGWQAYKKISCGFRHRILDYFVPG
jgi:hypothetical protein